MNTTGSVVLLKFESKALNFRDDTKNWNCVTQNLVYRYTEVQDDDLINLNRHAHVIVKLAVEGTFWSTLLVVSWHVLI